MTSLEAVTVGDIAEVPGIIRARRQLTAEQTAAIEADIAARLTAIAKMHPFKGPARDGLEVLRQGAAAPTQDRGVKTGPSAKAAENGAKARRRSGPKMGQ